jgi:3-hydroxyacyl-[acyl-carrier-protein] dehydratase
VSRIPATHPCLPGHFPGAPVVPGVVILDEVLRASAASGLAWAKFHAPLLPDEEFAIHVEGKKFSVRRGATLIASGVLR